MTEIKCYKCGKEIYFDNNFKSKTNKLIPLQKDTKQPHQCPKAGATSGLSKFGKSKYEKVKSKYKKVKSRFKTYKGSSSQLREPVAKYSSPDTKYIEGSSLAKTLNAIDERDRARIRKIVPESLYDADFVIVEDDSEINKEQEKIS